MSCARTTASSQADSLDRCFTGIVASPELERFGGITGGASPSTSAYWALSAESAGSSAPAKRSSARRPGKNK